MTRAADARLPVTSLSRGPANVDVSTRLGPDRDCSSPNLTYKGPDNGPLLIMQRPPDDAMPRRTPAIHGLKLACELQSCGLEPEWLTQWLVRTRTRR